MLVGFLWVLGLVLVRCLLIYLVGGVSSLACLVCVVLGFGICGLEG